MPAVTEQEMEALAPFIAGAEADGRGEVELYCPLHNDSRRSASLNVDRGVWFCHAGCGGGSVRRLVEAEDTWVPADNRTAMVRGSSRRAAEAEELPAQRIVAFWHRRLMQDIEAMEWLAKERGITDLDVIRKARIGWTGRYFKLPVLDEERRLVNIRTYDPYQLDPNRRKIWSVRGHGEARLYPVGVVMRAKPGSTILLCEGEWDTLLALQYGVQAVTRTDGAGKPWHHEWGDLFEGLRVFLCSDADTAGLKNDRIVGGALTGVAAEVRYCRLPYDIKPKNGHDLTDYLLEVNQPLKALQYLLDVAPLNRREG
jgi:putative DNA primase/helicase